MDNEEEDRGDVSAFDPFKGYSIIDTFLDNLDTYADVYDDGNAESGPSVSQSLSTRGLKKAIKDTCDKHSLSPRDLLNLVRRTTYKTAAWPPEEMGRHDDLKGMLRWLSDTVRSIERTDLRQELSFYEAERADRGNVDRFPKPKPHPDEYVKYLLKASDNISFTLAVKRTLEKFGITFPELREALINAYEAGEGDLKGYEHIFNLYWMTKDLTFNESVEDEDRGDVSSFPEPNWRASPQSAEEYKKAHTKTVLSMYCESVDEEEEGEGDISAFDFPKERAIAIANSFMKNAKQFGVEPWVVDVVCQGEGITRDTLYQCLTRAGKHKLISRIKRQFRESVEEDEGDVSDFPEPKTNPIIAHCGICGAPIGANGPITDIPADYDPDDYPRDDICDDCLRQQEHHYVTHEMALDAGDPDLEGTEW